MMMGRVARAWFRFEIAAMVAGTALLAVWLAVAPARAQSAADLMDRIQRLEAQVRSLTGQLEQSQFRVRQMEDQQRRMQADIEFRLNELENARGGARRPQQPAGQPQQQGQPPQRRSDAFDPSSSRPLPAQGRATSARCLRCQCRAPARRRRWWRGAAAGPRPARRPRRRRSLARPGRAALVDPRAVASTGAPAPSRSSPPRRATSTTPPSPSSRAATTSRPRSRCAPSCRPIRVTGWSAMPRTSWARPCTSAASIARRQSSS